VHDVLQPSIRRVLVTGGAGFIGGAVVRRLLAQSSATVFNLDKLGYASDCSGIEQILHQLALPADRYQLLRVDLADPKATAAAVEAADPDLVMHLAAESHVDRSIDGPGAFIESNVSGTFHLLQSVRAHWDKLPAERRERFRFHHISTDEVFGSLGPTGRFSETTPYDPRSPYSASKAASDHLVSAWHHTYGLPVVLTNCSNNYGPWQFPEKLIPVVILKALAGEPIPLYGDGANVRDWLYVDDHVEALLLAATQGAVGRSYCVGGTVDGASHSSERTNQQVVEAICALLDQLRPAAAPYARLITPVADRPGHDRRYAIDASRISLELGWKPRHSFEQGLAATVRWYVDHQPWCQHVRERAGYAGERIGTNG
jgi:dTDP-glucose 4,6-dehydratase